MNHATSSPQNPDDPSNGTLLSVRDLSVSFRTRSGTTSTVVESLSLDLPAGGALALVGESGSGKTVSMRAMLKLLPENAEVGGQVHFAGKDLLALSPHALQAVRGREIGMVFQNAMSALNPTLTLKRQLTEHLLWHRICTRAEATDHAIAALDRVGIPEPRRRVTMYPFQLSGGMCQRAMIAMAIATNPKIIIADEPTTAVDVTLQRQVLDLLKDLQGDGLSLIMITHDLGVARYSCDDVVVMRHGRVVESTSMPDFADVAKAPYSRQLLDAAVDVDLSVVESAEATAAPTIDPQSRATVPTGADGRFLLAADDLVKIFHGRGGDVVAVNDVSLRIGPGQTVAIVGQSGSGKSTLARLVMRLVEPTDGDITFDGRDMLETHGADLRRMRRQMQMVFQNPYGSLLPHLSISANVAESLRVHQIGDAAERRAKAVELLELVGIPAERADYYPRQFSGGQQQRVAIARALALEPQLLVCDEPTSALDVSIQAQILDLLADLQNRLDLSMLFVTHNLAVAQRLADRIIVMANGHVVESAATMDLFHRPRHPYTQALLAAVLPVRGEPLSWNPESTVDVDSGDLVEAVPGHWVRTSSSAITPASASPGESTTSKEK